jgi:ubiquinone/menaquinone biosynthesis C-methylase UbiE
MPNLSEARLKFNSEDFRDSEKAQIEHYAKVGHGYVNSRSQSVGHTVFLDFWINRILAPALSGKRQTLNPPRTILDPMCGSGESSEILLNKLSGSLIISDISANMLSQISEKTRGNERVRILEPQSARVMSISNESIDLIFVSGGLHHVYPILDDVLNEFSRVLVPGGVFVFGEPYDGVTLVRFIRKLFYKVSSKFDETSEHPFRKHELQSALKKAGFQDIELSPWGSFGYLFSGPVNVIPYLNKVRSIKFWKIVLWLDSVQSRIPFLREASLTVTGTARKKL